MTDKNIIAEHIEVKLGVISDGPHNEGVVLVITDVVGAEHQIVVKAKTAEAILAALNDWSVRR